MPFGPGTYGPFNNGPFGKTGGFFPTIPMGPGSMSRGNTGPIGQAPPGFQQQDRQRQRETPEQMKNRKRMREGMGGGIPTNPMGGMNQNQGRLQNIASMLQPGMGGGEIIQPPPGPSVGPIFNPLDRMKPMREPFSY